MCSVESSEYIKNILNVGSFDILLRAPLYVVVELSAQCNAKCIMCPRNITPHDRDGMLMPDHIREKVLNDLRPLVQRVRRIIPQCDGEPLCDPNLHVFIAALKEMGAHEVFITTNASLLTEERAVQLLHSGLDQCDISIDGFTKQTYEAIRQGLNFEAVTENIKNFFELRNKYSARTSIRLRYVLQDLNAHEVEAFERHWTPFIKDGDVISVKKVHTYGGKIDPAYYKKAENAPESCAATPCHHPFGTLTIWADGSVPFCTYDMNRQHPSENIQNKTLLEIWQGAVFDNPRRLHLTLGREGVDICKSCNATDPKLKLS